MSKQEELVIAGCINLIGMFLFKLPATFVVCFGIGALAWAAAGQFIGVDYTIGAAVVVGALSFPFMVRLIMRPNKRARKHLKELKEEADLEQKVAEAVDQKEEQ